MSSASASASELASAEQRSDTKYKGVRKRSWGKYVSEIRLPNSRERIWLGSYDSAKKAARAFDAALFCLRGSAANFNFPDNPPNIPGGRFLNAAEIQVAANRFANCCDDSPSISSSGSEMRAEAESPANYDGSFWNEFAGMGSSGNDIIHSTPPADPFHNVFPEFDDFSNDYFIPQAPPPPEEENSQEGLFLWNF